MGEGCGRNGLGEEGGGGEEVGKVVVGTGGLG